MEIKTEEVFHNGDAPFNRIHAAVGVYQNTGQGQRYFQGPIARVVTRFCILHW